MWRLDVDVEIEHVCGETRNDNVIEETGALEVLCLDREKVEPVYEGGSSRAHKVEGVSTQMA